MTIYTDTLVQQIVGGLSSDDQNELLAKAVVDVLRSDEFETAVGNAVIAQVIGQLEDMVATDEWQDKIASAIKCGFEDYLFKLRQAMPILIMQTIHGKQGKASDLCNIIGSLK